MSIKGLALLNAMREKAVEKNQRFTQACKEMGISQTYLSDLFSVESERTIENLDVRSLRQIAKYLEVPLGQIYILADILTIEDFIVHRTIDEDLATVYQLMKKDRLWADILPPQADFLTLDTRFKLLIALLYERDVGKTLLHKAELFIQGEKKEG